MQKLIKRSLLVGMSVLLLSACEEPTISEIESVEPETYSSIVDYIEKNNIDVKTVEEIQTQLENDYPWFKKQNLGVIRVLHKLHFGLETMEMMEVDGALYLKLNGTIYNQNSKDVVTKIFNDMKIYSQLGFNGDSGEDTYEKLKAAKKMPEEHLLKDDSVFKANSETPFTLYFEINPQSTGLYYYDEIKVVILKQELVLTEMKYYSELTEEEKALNLKFNKDVGLDFVVDEKFSNY